MAYSKIKIISFDLDNTLYDNWPVIQLAEEKSQKYLQSEFEKQRRKYDHQFFTQIRKELLESEIASNSNYRSPFDDLSLLRKKVLEKCCEELNNSDVITEKAFDIFIDYRSQVTIDKTITTMLEELSNYYLLVSLTNGNCNAEKLSISNYFRNNYSPVQGYRAKPHPEMLNEMMNDFNVAPEQVLHVGDQIDTDGEAAKLAGCGFYLLDPFKSKDVVQSCQVFSQKLLPKKVQEKRVDK